jgi:molybdopterin-guanine dinucleotide biosynthesis protein A
MTENILDNPIAVVAIILYGLLMITTCIYALKVSKQLEEYKEQQKAERLKHILEYHSSQEELTPLLGVVAPKTKTKKKD